MIVPTLTQLLQNDYQAAYSNERVSPRVTAPALAKYITIEQEKI